MIGKKESEEGFNLIGDTPQFKSYLSSCPKKELERLEKAKKERLEREEEEKKRQKEEERKRREKERKKREKEWEKIRTSRSRSRSGKGGKIDKGGKKMYYENQRPLSQEDVRSDAVEKAAEKVVEAKPPKGQESEQHRKSIKELKRLIGIQKENSPKEPFRTVYSLQKKAIRGEILSDVVFVVAKAIGRRQLAYIALAVCKAREALRKKGVNLQEQEITDTADAPNLERLLRVLDANGMEREYLALAEEIKFNSFKLYQKMMARAARRTVFAKNPDLGKQILLLTLTDELTKDYVGKLLGALKEVGAPAMYRVLAQLFEDESWRTPIYPKKVERPSEVVEEKAVPRKVEPTAEAKDVKLESLKLNANALKVLKKGRFVTIQDVKKVGIEKVADIKGIGPTTVKRLTEELVKIA